MLITPRELAPVMAYHLELFAVLALLSVSYSAVARRMERLRRGLTNGKVPNLLDAWTMAGALLLPSYLVLALVVVAYVAEWPCRKAVGGGRPKRYAVSVGVIALAALAASVVHQQIGGVLGVLPAVLVWGAVNSVLIACIVGFFGDRRIIPQLLSPKNLVFDTATKFVGAAVAGVLAWHLLVAVVALPAVLLGLRFALLRSIKEMAAFDARTGLWSESGWRVRAVQAVEAAPACVVLMLIDPERPNQEAQIAACLAGIRRSTDPIGRYGTRQVALLSEVDIQPAGKILVKHVRDRLREAGIECVVGTSISVGEGVDELLMRAGADLMERRAIAGVSARW